MATLEQLEAQIASLREEVTQAKQITSRHGDEHTGEGLDPYSPHGRNTLLPIIGEPTYDDVEDANTLFHSAGWFSGGAISDVGGGNITIAAGTGVLRSGATATTQLLFFDWLELATQAITANSIRYVGVEYNGGAPQATIRTTDNFNHFTDFELAIVVNESGTLHIQQHEHHAGDTSHTTIERFHQTMHIERDNQGGGLILSDSADGNNDIAVTAGALWIALDRFVISAIDTSGASTFDGYSSQGKEDTGIGAWPNTLYDNGSGGTGSLQTMGNNRWANLWWYMETDGDLVMVYGSNHYASEAQAEGEALPTTLPNRIQVHGLLIGRFIFQKGEDASQVLTAFTETFTVAGVTDHGTLVGLPDNDHPRYQTWAFFMGGV